MIKMNLNTLYPFLRISADVRGVTSNSKKVMKNFIFVAIKGKKTNGMYYVTEALEKGACLIITDQMVFGHYNHVRVKDAKKEYIRLLQLFYHYQHNIYTIGITGTDGKTTTATILNHILDLAKSSAYIGTNGISYLHKQIPLKHTTPTPDTLYEAYSVFRKHHINNIVMEVSSEGLLDKRVDQLEFDGAIYTNLSHEHLNTHKTMYQYFRTKAKLFESLKPSALAVLNCDDPFSRLLAKRTKAKIVTYGINSGLYMAKNTILSFEQSEFDVYYKDTLLDHYILPLFGQYNIYNALAAIAYTNELGIDKNIIKKGIETVTPISGRFMHYCYKDIIGVVDFAHTPNALENLLLNIKTFAKKRMILVMGAAGEKDKTKRSIMGEIAASNADITIFTSEDPKNESIFSIFKDLTRKLSGKDYYLTVSRKEAILLATKLAEKDDIIIITGKGNENNERIFGYLFRHNDFQFLQQALTNKLSI